ncbi:MAG: energy-coupling factor ABC transporter ATP-binding protein [Lutisporaceae bacterium]
MGSFIILDNVGYTYPDNNFSIKDISIDFHMGKCAGLIGANGCGKTTLSKIIAGLISPQYGRVLIDGEDTAKKSLAWIGSRIGYLFQEPSHQIFAPIVNEEISFALTLKGMSKEAAEELTAEMLARFDLTQIANNSTLRLSRGEKQRLALAAILANKPSYIVLDEPTTGLDQSRREMLSRTIDQLLFDGIGIILISHDLAFVNRHVDRIFKMKDGVIYDEA